MKILTLYFSKSGHTRKLAEEIHDAIGGDLGEIRTKKKYSSSYGISVLQVGVEKMIGRMPELEEDEYRAEDYDVILLGGPTWYYTIASAVQVWIKNHDLKGKRVYTFSTSGGGPKDTLSDFRKMAEKSGADVKGQLHAKYRLHTRLTGELAIQEWIRKVKEDLHEI